MAGLGVGIALQGVLSNMVAGLSIIMTKPFFRVGSPISIVRVYRQVGGLELFSTTPAPSGPVTQVMISQPRIVSEILHNHDHQAA